MYDPQNVCVAWTPGVGSKLKRYVENLNRQHFPGHHFEIPLLWKVGQLLSYDGWFG